MALPYDPEVDDDEDAKRRQAVLDGLDTGATRIGLPTGEKRTETATPTSPGGRDQALSSVSSSYQKGLYDQQRDDPNAAGYSPYTPFDEQAERKRLQEEAARKGLQYDESDLADIARTYYNTGPHGGLGGNLELARANASRKYDERLTNTPGSDGGSNGGRSSGSSSGSGAGGAMDSVLQRLYESLQADRDRQSQERAQMRQLLMDQIANASRPVNPDDPGIAPILGAQRLASQRSAERSRQDLAEQLAADDQLFAGAFQPRADRIEQARGEDETQFVGQILNQELSSRRAQLQGLMALAVNSGDAESARALQAQLSLIDSQLQQTRFGSQLGFDRYRFDNDAGLRLLQLELLGNQTASNALGF